MRKKTLFKLYLQVKLFNFKEHIKVIYKYYRNLLFLLVDTYFHINYFLKNPYRICRLHSESIYGETPLTTWEKIAKEANISKKDILIELGAGRGRLAIWSSIFLKCQTHAVEYIPEFISIAKKTIKIFNLPITFKNINYFNCDIKNASVIYLYGTCLSDNEIFLFINKAKFLDKNTKIITISYSLNEYSEDFSVIKQFPVIFPWGETTAYIQTIY